MGVDSDNSIYGACAGKPRITTHPPHTRHTLPRHNATHHHRASPDQGETMNALRRHEAILLLACSLACCAAGLYLVCREHDGPAVGVTAAGELLYSQSSGSGDCMFLGVGLLGFALTAASSLAALRSPSARARPARAYLVSLAWFLFMLWLVILDSNLVDAASLGDPMPLLSLLPALAPALTLPVMRIYGWLAPGKAGDVR